MVAQCREPDTSEVCASPWHRQHTYGVSAISPPTATGRDLGSVVEMESCDPGRVASSQPLPGAGQHAAAGLPTWTGFTGIDALPLGSPHLPVLCTAALGHSTPELPYKLRMTLRNDFPPNFDYHFDVVPKFYFIHAVRRRPKMKKIKHKQPTTFWRTSIRINGLLNQDC